MDCLDGTSTVIFLSMYSQTVLQSTTGFIDESISFDSFIYRQGASHPSLLRYGNRAADLIGFG